MRWNASQNKGFKNDHKDDDDDDDDDGNDMIDAWRLNIYNAENIEHLAND